MHVTGVQPSKEEEDNRSTKSFISTEDGRPNLPELIKERAHLPERVAIIGTLQSHRFLSCAYVLMAEWFFGFYSLWT